MRKVYLDNGSTTFPKAPGVGPAMSDFIVNVGCNVGRGGYESAYNLAETVFNTRSLLCRMFNFPDERYVVFTPSVTYSLNFVVKGLLKPGDHVIISAMEHNASARPCEDMKKAGVMVSVAGCDRDGRLDFEEFEKLFRPETRLVVLVHASNVSGTLLDARRAGRICREKGVFFALDAAQSAGVVDIDFENFGLSALCVTGHKGLLGPQGIGACELASGFGNRVNMLDINYDAMLKAKEHFPDNVNFMFSNRENLVECLKVSDVVINCILWPKTRKDHLIYREDLKLMKKGAMIIDVACDDEGAVETCRSTCHKDPVYYEEGILHYCVDNIPSAFAQTASTTLCNATLPFTMAIANKGVKQALKDDKHLRRGLTTYEGKLTLLETAEKLDLPYTDANELVKEF